MTGASGRRPGSWWRWWLASIAVAAGGCGYGFHHPAHPKPREHGLAYREANATAPAPLLEARIAAIRLADDDGKRQADVSPRLITRWVDFANQVFWPAGIRFRFDADGGDFIDVRSSVLNRIDHRQPDAAAKRAGDQLAARFPERLVVLFHTGRRDTPSGGGYSGADFDFVVMPGAGAETNHCGHDNLAQLAHELGHHLGLAHPFSRPFRDADLAARHLRNHQGDLTKAFDGDGLTDTPPDPAVVGTECDDVSTLDLEGTPIALPRRNIMSYYDEADSLTAQQVARARFFLRDRLAHAMKRPRNSDGRPAVEAEALEFLFATGCRPWVQPMRNFDGELWRGGKQVLCMSPAPASFEVELSLPSAGRYPIDIYLTRGPDFGIVEVLVNGEPVGSPQDAWAPVVLASGRITLGERELAAGPHRVLFRTKMKNASSTAFGIGIDALSIGPAVAPPASRRRRPPSVFGREVSLAPHSATTGQGPHP